MHDDLPPILRADTYGARSREAETLRRLHAAGRLHRVARGCFVAADAWETLKPRERHIVAVRALRRQVPQGAAVSHVSAACLYDWWDVDTLPDRLHVIDPAAGRTQSRRQVVRHAAPLAASEVWAFDGIPLTSPLRTAVDIALTLPFVSAVAALDCALKRDDLSRETILAALDAVPRRRGVESARRAVHFADARSGSAAESFARVLLFEMRAPRPELQRTFRMPGGRFAGTVDFFFPDQGVVLEIDGDGKYTDPDQLDGKTSADAFIDEKTRENRLFECPEVRRIIRAGWRELRRDGRLRGMLRASGVPVP